MCVNICSGREIAVTEPFLNLLHRHTVCKHQAGTGVPEIMETDVTEAIGLQKLRELLCYIMGLDEITDLVDADITKVFPVVRPSTESSVIVLFCFDCKQPVFDKWNERKGSHTGFSFGRICRNKNMLAVEVYGCDGVLDNDGIIIEINRIPFKTDDLASTQTVECTEENWQFPDPAGLEFLQIK